MSVKVRFAPSPSGALHVGNARVALINYVFSLSMNGQFIVRFDDTDAERSSPRAAEEILSDLKWLGLEKINDVVSQSRRLSFYQELAQKLLEEGKAYMCFCSPEELREMKKALLDSGKPPRYTGKCRSLSKHERDRLIKAGKKYTIRFKVLHSVSFRDLIRGEFHFHQGEIEDFIILRSDRTPTYNFACAVDDAHMGITHVIRGEDHISNTPRQLLIIKALFPGAEPTYVHLPLIVKGDGSPLSKREGSTSIRELRNEGYLPEAVASYLINLGWNKLEEGPLSLTDIARIFDIKEISLAQPRYSPEGLRFFNLRAIRERINNGSIYSTAEEFLKAKGILIPNKNPEHWRKFIDLIAGNITTLADIIKYLGIYDEAFISKDQWEALNGEDVSILEKALERLPAQPEEEFEQLAELLGVSKGKVMKTIRVAISGLSQGPPLKDILKFLGDSWKLRVKNCIEHIKSQRSLRTNESI